MSTHICESCGTIAKPKRHMKGSFVIEVFLWLMLIVPGLLYSLWRLTTKSTICGTCQSAVIVPIKTPRGRKLLEQFHTDSQPNK
jgi:hypothetical protein